MNVRAVLYFLVCHAVALTAATDFHVTVTPTAAEQSFVVETGTGVPGTIVNVEVYDKCKRESDARTSVGELYPSSTVRGLSADHSGLQTLPGTGGVISFSFVEGIAQNYDVYTNNGDNTGKVEFCVQVNLYIGDFVANFAEVKLTYNINLATDISMNVIPQRTAFDLAITNAPTVVVEDRSDANATTATVKESLNATTLVDNSVNDTDTDTQLAKDAPLRHLRLTLPPLASSTMIASAAEYGWLVNTIKLLSVLLLFVLMRPYVSIRFVNPKGNPKGNGDAAEMEGKPTTVKPTTVAEATPTPAPPRTNFERPQRQISRRKNRRGITPVPGESASSNSRMPRRAITMEEKIPGAGKRRSSMATGPDELESSPSSGRMPRRPSLATNDEPKLASAGERNFRRSITTDEPSPSARKTLRRAITTDEPVPTAGSFSKLRGRPKHPQQQQALPH